MLQRADILRFGVGGLVLAGLLSTWSERGGCGSLCRIVTPPVARAEPEWINGGASIEAASALQMRHPNPSPGDSSKTDRVAAIVRDYAEIATEVSNQFTETTGLPDGLNTFLGQLALVRREQRADLARVLTPRELEDHELRESPAGMIVQALLGGTSATDEQRRSVFRLQAAFDERFGLNFDSSPTGNFDREKARVRLQENIHRVLGDELFLAWLAGEGTVAASAPAAKAIEHWRTKTMLNLRRLELIAAGMLTPEQLRAAYDQAQREAQSRSSTGSAQ